MSYRTPGPVALGERAYRYGRGDDRGEGGVHGQPRAWGSGAAGASDGALEADVQRFGMRIFLASLTVVFASTFVAYGIMWWRHRAGWQSVVTEKEVGGLIVASGLLIVADVCATRAKKAPVRARARKLTIATVVAASVYLVVQSLSWVPLLERANAGRSGGDLRMEGFLFLMLTFAHAVHVLGGIVASGVVLARSRGGRGPRGGALRLLSTYWRFLTVMWVAVLALLFVA